MKRNISKIIAFLIAVISIITTAVPVMAADANNSKGSKGTDIAVLDDSTYSVEGKDTKQNKKSEYELFTYDGNDIISSVNVYGTVADGSDVYDPENPDADDDGFVNGKIQVGVPTTIIIDGKANSEGYFIGEASGKVKGNISGATIINVVPDDEVVLSSEGKRDVTAPIEQDYTQFVVATSEFGGAKVNKNVTPNFNDKAVFDVSVKTKELSAGSWAGSFNYNISVTNTGTTAHGQRVKSWNISATEDDDVWMTYYQPETASGSSAQFSTLNATRSNAKSTTVNKYEDGTVVIRGTGNMEMAVNKHFYDIKALNTYANEQYWSNIHNYLTDDEYESLIAAVNEGTSLFEYYSSSSISTTDSFNALSTSLQKIARKAHFGVNPNEQANFKLYVPKTIIIEEGVTNVSDSAFSTCAEVESVTIPSSVTTIEKAAFSNCRKLNEISSLKNITSFGAFSFNGCTKLTDIELGKDVTSVGQMAFDNMTATIHCPTQSIADMITYANRTSTSAQPTLVVE